MKQNTVQTIFFVLLLVVVVGLTLFVFAPFFQVLVLAAVFAIALQPVFKGFTKLVRGRKGIAALLTIIASVGVIGVPVTLIATQVVEESRALYTDVTTNTSTYVDRITQFVEGPLKQYSPNFNVDFRAIGASFLSWVTNNVGAFISGTVQIVLGLLLMLGVLFFFLRDGASLLATIKATSPLPDDEDKEILGTIGATINAIARGMVIVGAIQGVLVGLGLWFFGIPNATLWGTLAAFAAMVPGLGTALVIVPAVIFLIISNAYGEAIGLSVWGVAIVGTVDNLLAPYFYGKGIKIHPIIILLSVLGGLSSFGLLGFIYGPVIVSVFVVMLHVYQARLK